MALVPVPPETLPAMLAAPPSIRSLSSPSWRSRALPLSPMMVPLLITVSAPPPVWSAAPLPTPAP